MDSVIINNNRVRVDCSQIVLHRAIKFFYVLETCDIRSSKLPLLNLTDIGSLK
jgi:hypothetical protein